GVGHQREHLGEQRPGHQRRQRGIGRADVGSALDQRVLRDVVGAGDPRRRTRLVVVEGQRRGVVDQVQPAVPEEQVR
ncbi:hypothetical protein, partial [Enterococcus faecalis]|uniref:hypothetical protein n=1 Tax=Enterococcus faecalis TaxID=1351 RepID=UPI003D6AC5BE